MARPLRIEFENAFYHVMNRGSGSRNIFHDEKYYNIFLEILGEAHDRFGIEIHAYCLMCNHYHLLIKTPEANLSRVMRHINGVYTQRHNKLSDTDGPLFRGRYKAIIVDSDSYLLQLSKYIHLNPLDAGLVTDLEQYPWSSYPAYIKTASSPNWLVKKLVYCYLTAKKGKALKYQMFVENSELDPYILDYYYNAGSGSILGSDEFLQTAGTNCLNLDEVSRPDRKQLRPDIKMILSAVSQVMEIETDDILKSRKGRGLKNQPRQIAMFLAQKLGDYRLNDIAEIFGLSHYGSASNAIYQVKDAMADDVKLCKTIKRITRKIDSKIQLELGSIYN